MGADEGPDEGEAEAGAGGGETFPVVAAERLEQAGVS
jgi:hypothetical protein